MSYPGAGRQHGHHQQVGGGGGMPQPNYGEGGYGGPPQGGWNPGYGGPPPPQQQFGGGGGFPQPQYQQAPPPHQSYQQYAPPPNQGFPQPSYEQQQQQQQGYAPPPMHYAPPGAPPPQNLGPAQYQGAQFQAHMQPVRNQQMYSNCSGKRKALLVGVNYTGSSAALRWGCHNDVKNLASFLMERYSFKKEDMVLLMDLPQGTAMEQPTRANITRAMQWLVRDAQPNDSLFFHYSGHGGQAKDLDGDEDDGYDETIYPLDFKTAGQMIDDEMHDLLVRPLPQGCRLTAIFDSCHSGSALDLPYIFSTKGVIKQPNMLADAGSGALSALTSYARGDLGGVFKSITGVGKRLTTGNSAQQKTKAEKTSYADVIMWSGCKDSQTSADATEAGSATGAMSWAFKNALTKYPQQTYLQLLNTIRDELQGKYDQKPQLSCSHELDTSLLAIL